MMRSFFNNLTAIGVEQTVSGIKGAEVSFQKKHPIIHRLHSFTEIVKPLYTVHSLVVTGMDSSDILVRSLRLALTKEKDIQSALAFQMEPLLPYSIEETILTRQTLSQDAESTQLTVLSAQKSRLQRHLEQWQQAKIEPEQVGCIQSALCYFAHYYLPNNKPYLILHANTKWITCILAKDGKLLGSYVQQEGLPHLQKDMDMQLQGEAIKRFQQATSRMSLALLREVKEVPEGILMTGEAASLPDLEKKLTEKLNLPLLFCHDSDGFTSQEKQIYAVSIGLAIGSFFKQIDFRQQEFAYPAPWKRIKAPLIAYFACMSLFTLAFFLFSQAYLSQQENQLKQEYSDFLSTMNKSHEDFESKFLAKNPAAKEKVGGEIVDIIHLQREDLQERIDFLQKDLQATPDSFPLFANIPRVSDVLAWLSRHPLVIQKDENEQPYLQLENFSYVMLRRPAHSKKQEKYQVKVELEFTSPMPKRAREFHDALIASNDFVDPKGEVKWSSNRGSYRTSFYLKDKTLYLGQ